MRQCDPLAWNRCDPQFAAAILSANLLSMIACVWLLCSFRKLHGQTQIRLFPRQMWWLAFADCIYHTSWVVTPTVLLALPKAEAHELFQGRMAVGVLSCIQQPPLAVSVLIEGQISLYCLAIAFRLQSLMSCLAKALAWNWLFGLLLAFGHYAQVVPNSVEFVFIGASGVLNTCSYAVVMGWMWRRHSPGSVQRRHLKRLAIYPITFFITFGWLLVGNRHYKDLDFFPISVSCSGLNGFLNVVAYAWQSRHFNALRGTIPLAGWQPAGSFNTGIGDAEFLDYEGNTLAANERATCETSAIDAEKPYTLENARELCDGADILVECGSLTFALEEYRRCLEMLRVVSAVDSYDYASTLSKTGATLMSLGLFHPALAEHQEASEVKKRLFGEFSFEFAASIFDVGIALDSSGDGVRGMLVLRHALEIAKNSSGESPEYAGILRRFCDVLVVRNLFDEACASFEECTRILVKMCGARSVEYVATLHSEGCALLKRGRVDAALAMFLQCEDILKELNDVNVQADKYHAALLALTVRGRGDCLAANKDWEKAITCYRDSRALQKKAIGQETLEFGVTERKIEEVLEACPSLVLPPKPPRVRSRDAVTEEDDFDAGDLPAM